MLIGKLASASGVSTRALRYYEQRGLLASRRQSNGYREYDDSAVLRVQNIRVLLDAGLSAENIRSLSSCLAEDFTGVPVCRQAVALYEKRLLVVRGQLAALREMEGKLEDGLRELQHHDVPAAAVARPGVSTG